MINVTEIVDEVAERLEVAREAAREALEGPPPPGLKPVSDEAFMQFVISMREQYPPEPIVTPWGEQIFESPWIVMCSLKNVDGGRAMLDRINRIAARIEVM